MASTTPARSKILSAHPHSSQSRRLNSLLLCAMLGIAEAVSAAPPLPEMSHTLTALKPAKAAKDFSLPDLDGKPHRLSDYRGKVVLVVNTASYCGYTEQYKGLQALHDKYQKRGLVVLGFPANDFGKQEPGSNAEVADFCERTFKVKFPIIEKTSVVAVAGRPANPVYEALFKATGERPQWNFHKFLVARDGATVKSFSSRVAPESDEFKAEVEALLVAK